MANTGSGSQDGTSCDNAWYGWTGINWDNMSDGDTLHICDTLYPIHDIGIQHSNITLTGDGVGKIDFSGHHAALKTYAWYDGAGHHATNVVIKDLEVFGSDYVNVYLTAADETDGTFNKVIHCEVHDLQSTDNTRSLIISRGNHNTIKDSVIYNGPGDMIYQRGNDFTFENNTIFGITNSGSSGRGDGLQCSGSHTGYIIKYNHIDISSFYEPKQCIIIQGNNATISYNWLKSQNYGTETTHSNVVYVSGTDENIHHNRIMNGYYGIWLSSASGVVRYNMVSGLNRGGIAVTNRSHDLGVINNTVFNFYDNVSGDSCYGIYVSGDSSNIEVKNNIMAGSPDYGLWSNVAIDNDYNLYFGNLSDNTHNISMGSHSIVGNPFLNGDGHIDNYHSSSINSGTSISGIHDKAYPENDIDLQYIVNSPDIGCDEFHIPPKIKSGLIRREKDLPR